MYRPHFAVMCKNGVQQCQHVHDLAGCFPTGFPVMALPYELRVLIWHHAACLRRAISSDWHEAHHELCWYLDRPAVPVDVCAVLQDVYDSADERGPDVACARWLLHAFSNEPAR